MKRISAYKKLKKAVERDYHICVGLDTDKSKIPIHLLSMENPVLEFNKIVIQNTFEYAAAYKINFAFYESEGIKGIETMIETLKLIPDSILVIADAKRGDIGNTSKKYAQSIYDRFKFDSVTLHPYMGYDSVSPFLEYGDKLNFILGLTSNPSSENFEKLNLSNGRFLYQEVIEKVNEWNKSNNCGIVFGATNSDELKLNINNLKKLPLLLPGVGAQGGNLESIISLFRNVDYHEYLINISRGLLYIDSSPNFGAQIKSKLTEYNNIIKSILNS